MNRIRSLLRYALSMPAMAIGLLLFALSIGVATFIENDYGTPTAKAEVYYATWFFALQVYLSINLVANMIRFKMHKKPFAMITIFHTAFLLIFVGSIITHFFGYEGMLPIREGKSNNMLISSNSYVELTAYEQKNDALEPVTFEKEVLMSKLSANTFSRSYSVGKQEVTLTLNEYKSSVDYGVVEDKVNGVPMIEMMVVGGGGPETVILKEGESYENSAFVLDFDSKKSFSRKTITIYRHNGSLFLKNSDPLFTMNMDSKEQKMLPTSDVTPFNMRTLHALGENRFVLRGFFEKGKESLVSKESDVRRRMNQTYPDALLFTVRVGDEEKNVTVLGSASSVGEKKRIVVGGLGMELSFGAKLIKLPFDVRLDDFELERYPGSMAPSSYSSKVVVLDSDKNVTLPYHIYMNHVLDYRGFRFFQSSYDQDELGTVLSVNNDPGTLPTYIGYALLALGMFGSFFVKRGRFQTLRKRLEKLSDQRNGVATLLFALFLASDAVDLKAAKGFDIQADPDGKPMVNLVLAQHNGSPEVVIIEAGETVTREGIVFDFSGKSKAQSNLLGLFVKNDQLYVSHANELFSMQMQTQKQEMLQPSLQTAFESGKLYGLGEYNFVVRNFLPKAKKVEIDIPDAAPEQEAQKPVMRIVDEEHASKFGYLLSQKEGGRLEPVDSLALDILHKVYKKGTYKGQSANQVILGMLTQPEIWYDEPLIKLEHGEVAKLLGLDENVKYAAYGNFYPANASDNYVLEQYVSDARRKAAKDRNKLDKALLKVDERVHIVSAAFQGLLLNIFPLLKDDANKWYNIADVFEKFPPNEKQDAIGVLRDYFISLEAAEKSGNYSIADENLEKIKTFQRFNGASIFPDDYVIALEIYYNQSNLFIILMIAFLIVGVILLILSFVNIIKPSFKIEWASKSVYITIAVLFAFHTLGLAARWIISGHAPWSNGYEAILYVAWATALAGLIVGRTSPFALSATAVMTGVTLFVAWISAFDPQITNLVPVLKSYWLSIHVSMITGSYGFLGLSAIIGFITLILFITLNDKNNKRISLSIKELNLVNEMSIMIGLVMLTVGNFLGGVWANESWGRYWGWDAKETWALVSILVYAALSHMRVIGKLYTDFRFAMASLVAFSAILMTFFGVNYYLSGMHSYAKGDAVPVPAWVLPAIIIVALLILAAWYRQRRFVK